MLLNPYRFGVQYGVRFISSAGANYVTSGTSINSPSTPAAIQEGDGLFAIVLARSALTPPAGWSLIASQAVLGATAQSVYVYRKDTTTSADSTTAFTWTQAASGRMGLAYIVCRSTTGAISVVETAGATTSNISLTVHPVTIPVLTATANGELVIMAATSVLASTSASDNTWAAPAGAALRTITTQADNRIGAATHARNSGQSNATPMTLTQAVASTNEFASLSIRLAPA
jgi:hypothetical protein